MIKKIIHKFIGTRNQRLLKEYHKIVSAINQLEATTKALSDSDLQACTHTFKQRLANGEPLANLLPQALAVCKEASVRVLHMRPFDMQLVGALVLNDGKIAEMRTGEGKTLVGTMAAYCNALNGQGVHIVTVNDYLANRDQLEMGRLLKFLGISVGVNLPNMTISQKQQAYLCDVIYGTNNEFGFDYLRDNMAYSLDNQVQRQLSFAIIDEVDSILIDEARTPLIISGPSEESQELYIALNQLPKELKQQITEDSTDGDFFVDEKNHNVVLSEQGHERVEKLLTKMGLLNSSDSLYSINNIALMHHLLAALKAHYVYHKDQHYVVQNNEVIIVDEFTGRLMNGRRWSDGLHQAIEAKESIRIQQENQTMASITLQNYFRMYKKLSGMTGTADTEAYEFQQIYGQEVVVVPTNKPMVRKDYNDKIYMNLTHKYQAIVLEVLTRHQKGQPVLIGTTSVENSEIISRLLKEAKLNHQVLNAKNHDKEASIIAQAGALGAITVATNMAGRGTDIILGGSPKSEIFATMQNDGLSQAQKDEQVLALTTKWQQLHADVVSLGGLAIIGTERHESRRIDNQLRGRAGRQGDPGETRFYLSLEDSLLRIFGGDKMRSMMQRLGVKEGEAIEHKWLSRSIEGAQRKVEGHNFDIRKQLLDYDNVANDQRHVIYEQRNKILASTSLTELITQMFSDVMAAIVDRYLPAHLESSQWDVGNFDVMLRNELLLDYSLKNALSENSNLTQDGVKEQITNHGNMQYLAKIAVLEQMTDTRLSFEKHILLEHIDYYYRIHLANLEQLRQGIHLRGYAQKDPKREYQVEAFNLFAIMLSNIKEGAVRALLAAQFVAADAQQGVDQLAPKAQQTQLSYHANSMASNDHARKPRLPSRNSLCDCGSGKKYKHCHGRFT